MEELAPHRAGAPDVDVRRVGALGLVRLDDQRRHDMALHQVEIVARPVEIGRHDRDEVAAILAAIGLAELDAGDLGDRVPLVGRLERAGQQRLLGDRLRRQTRIDAGGAQQQQLLDAGAPRRLDDVRSGWHQVVVEELGRPRVVGEDAADPRGGEEHRLRPRVAPSSARPARAGAGRPTRAAPSGSRSLRAARRRTSALPTRPRWPATQTRLLRSV